MNSDLKQVLAQWPQWFKQKRFKQKRCKDTCFKSKQSESKQANRAPTLVRPMKGGLTNRSYLLEVGNSLLVLRLNAANSLDLGIDRKMELDVLSHACAAGIAPPVVYADPDYRYLVSVYLEGNQWCKHRTSTDEQLQSIAELLCRVHRLPVAAVDLQEDAGFKVFNALQRAEHYWQALQTQNNTAWRILAPYRKSLHRYFLLRQQRGPVADTAQYSFCHNDPVSENVIVNDRGAFLIDWEYASLGNPAFDLAVYTHNENLNADAVDRLLESYRKGHPAPVSDEQFRSAQIDYCYLDLLWCALQQEKLQSVSCGTDISEILNKKLDKLTALTDL